MWAAEENMDFIRSVPLTERAGRGVSDPHSVEEGRTGKCVGEQPRLEAERATFAFGVEVREGENGEQFGSAEDTALMLARGSHPMREVRELELLLETGLEGGVA